jgi:hypothetical protein
MKRIFSIAISLAVVTGATAQAANLAVITSPPTLLNVFILGIAIACAVASIKILELVRGGQMSKSWQILIIGFIIFAASQIVSLCVAFEIVNLPAYVVPALVVVALGLFLYGIFETKRILS